MEPGSFDSSIRPTKNLHGCCCKCGKKSHRAKHEWEKSEKCSQFHTSGYFKYHMNLGYGGCLFAKAFAGCFFCVSWTSKPQDMERSRVVKQRMKFCYLGGHGCHGLGYNFWDSLAAARGFWFSTQCQFGLGIGNLGKCKTWAFDAGNCPNCSSQCLWTQPIIFSQYCLGMYINEYHMFPITWCDGKDSFQISSRWWHCNHGYLDTFTSSWFGLGLSIGRLSTVAHSTIKSFSFVGGMWATWHITAAGSSIVGTWTFETSGVGSTGHHGSQQW